MKISGLVSFLLMLVLSIPILPFREVGKLLSSNQMTEEIPHNADGLGKAAGKIFPFQEEVITDSEEFSIHLSAKQSDYLHFSIKLPAEHAGEIPTPPPNFFVC